VCEVQPYWSHMCQSLDHMHRHSVCHRDLRLPIMLLSFKDNTVGVADFGLTRNCFPMEAPTTWQPTAPQCSADLWTLGVVIAALCEGEHLFTKEHEANQLHAHIEFVGRPEDTWPIVAELRRWVELAPKLQMRQPSREPSVALSSPKSVARHVLP
jgi:serine/threonine protein kinase